MTDQSTDLKVTSKTRFPIVTLLLLTLASTGLFYAGGDAAITIIILSVVTIALIIFGERYSIDYALEKKGLPGREAWLPVLALSISIYMGAVSPETIPEVISDKLDIIALILSFAVISEGIARSGYFSFAAYKIVQKCQGNTSRLILYLFILTSVLTFVTSNDIVVLVFTPIIIAVCMHARIENMRLLLLSQFIAANTLSMGLLIGSPTNIILSKELGIDFFQYFVMMVIPSILACMLSFIVVDFINQRSKPGTRSRLFNFKGRWTYHDTYSMPNVIDHAYFTDAMRNWLWLFTAAVGLLALISSFEKSLFWAALPITFVSLGYIFYEVRKENEGTSKEAVKNVKRVVRYLPYSIFFFGMSYFVFAAELSQHNYVSETLLPFIKNNLLDELIQGSVSMVMLSGLLVNAMNDLPAAALVGELLQQMELTQGGLEGYTKMIVLQALLIGLNIGCYVTPIGALAGLLWFSIIRKEERLFREQKEKTMKERGAVGTNFVVKHEMPNRLDLVIYGLMMFLFVGLISGVLLPFMAQILDVFISPPNAAMKTPISQKIGLSGYLPLVGAGLLAFIFMKFRKVLVKNRVFLGHMREVFVILTRVTIWSMKNKMMYHGFIGLGVLVAASTSLYWAEVQYHHLYGVKQGLQPLFLSAQDFMTWLLKYTSSGLSEKLQPRSTLGLAVTGVLPMLAIGVIIVLSRLTTESGAMRLTKQLAKGEIPGYRIIVVNHHSGFEKFVTDVLSIKDASVLLLCTPAQIDRAQSFCRSFALNPQKSHRVYAALKSSDAYHNFMEYRMVEANEVYLLSDMTVEGEYEKLRYLTKLDEAISGVRLSQLEVSDLSDMGVDGVPEEAEWVDGIDAVSVSGVPKIVMESSSRRFDELVKRSSSQFLLKNLVQISFDDDLADFILSDLDKSLYLLNKYYHFGEYVEEMNIFVDEETPNSLFYLSSYPLDEEGKKLFGSYFGGTELDVRSMDVHDLVQHSMFIRQQLQRQAKKAKYIVNNKKHSIPTTDFFGVTVSISGEYFHMGVPSAALSMQSSSTEEIIIKQPINDAVSAPKAPDISVDLRLFIFNLNPVSKAFIRKVIQQFKGQKKAPQIFLLYHGMHSVPEDIQQSKMVTSVYGETIEELLNIICPTDVKRKAKTHLKSGDRIYAFNDFDTGSSPELTSIDFLDRLDGRIRRIVKQAKKTPRITHKGLYIAVEVQGNEGRFLFENFFVDKIIDSTRSRVTYLEVLSKIMHRTIGQGSLLGHRHATYDDFLQTSSVARYLSRFVVDFAEDVTLRDLNGHELSLIGLDYETAASQIQSYSNPPRQMFARVKLISVSVKGKSGRAEKSFKLENIPVDEPIQKGHFILCLPLV